MTGKSPQTLKREAEIARMAERGKQPLAEVFSTQVVGVSFIDGYPHNLLDMQSYRMANPGTMWLTLKREPENPYDANAIGVWWDGHKIGHLNKVIAYRMAPELDAGQSWLARVEEIAGDDELVGITIRCKREE
jgi:hypothetical protein